ncbi:MAG: helix-turn-helix transcriptional regulator [Bacteroidales bacterium]
MEWYGITDVQIAFELGKRIRATRLRKKFSQVEVAERAGISKFTIGQMENGKNTSLASLIAVMRVLKLLENFDSLIPQEVISPVEMLAKKNKKR